MAIKLRPDGSVEYSSEPIGQLKSGSGGGIKVTPVKKMDLTTPEGLRAYAESIGLEPPKKRRIINALQTVGGIVNMGTATIAGGVRGALRPDMNPVEGMIKGFQERKTFGFADVFREDLGINPQTRGGKIGLGVSAFAADVFLDPLTYLTFGVSGALKVGGKALTKSGGKLATKASREIVDHNYKELIAKGMAPEVAQKVANQRVNGVVNDLVQRTFGKKGITNEAAREYLESGISHGTITAMRSVGPEIIDRGGIKMFGKTLVSSEAIKNSVLGKAARRLGEVEVIKVLGQTLGKTFVADFGKNPALVKAIDRMAREQKRAMEGIIKSNAKLFGDLTDDQMSTLASAIFEKKLQVTKVADRMEAKKVLKQQKFIVDDFGGDEKIFKVAEQLFEKAPQEGQLPIIARFAKAAGVSEEEAIKFYFPSLFMDKLQIKDFAAGRNISSPSYGWLKEFTGVDNAQRIKDPFVAYSRNQAAITTARIKDRGFRSIIKTLGTTDEVLAKKLGYTEMTRTGIGGQKVTGYLPKEIAEEANRFLSPQLSPIDELSKAVGFDWATGIFKGWVTSMFPAFHFRNMTSNQFQNMAVQGLNVLNPATQATAAKLVMSHFFPEKFGYFGKQIIKLKNGKTMKLEDIARKISKESDILDASGPFGRIEQFLGEGEKMMLNSKASKLKDLNPLSRQFVGLKVGRAVGTTLETQSKMVGVLTALIEGKSVKEGIKLAEDALFNYGKLSPFERTVMRRLIPFYTFTRKNIELQLKTLTQNPGRVANQLKFFRGMGTAIGEQITEDDLASLPEWMLDGILIKSNILGVDENGMPNFISGFGTPIEEFLERFSGDKGILWNAVQDTLVKSNPVIKFPLEKATGKDFFRDRPITEISSAKELKSFIDFMPGPVAEQFKSLIEFREIPDQPIYVGNVQTGTRTLYSANPFALHFIRNLPTARLTGTIGFINDDEQVAMNKAMRVFTGVRAWTIDTERQKFFKDLDERQQLTSWLVRMGVLKEFTRPFVPKE